MHDTSLLLPPPTTNCEFKRQGTIFFDLKMRDRKDFKYIVVGGSLLSLNAGFINAVFLLSAMQLAVAHVTGLVAKASVDLGEAKYEQCGEIFVLFLAFYAGATISSLLIGTEQFQIGHAYGRTLLVISALLCVSAFNLTQETTKTYRLMSIAPAAMALGMQNAMTTKFSGAVIRTTHLTGLTTDLGVLTAHWLQGQADAPLWRFKLFIPQLLCFFCGGVLGAQANTHFGNRALFIPASFTGALGITYIVYLARKFQRSIKEIITRDTSGVRDGTARWMTPTPSQYRAATPYTDTSGGPTVVWSVTPPSCVLCPSGDIAGKLSEADVESGWITCPLHRSAPTTEATPLLQ